MTITRGSPVLTYNNREDGYICRQRTRIEKKPAAYKDWSFVAHLIMGTCCLAAFLFIISEDLLMPTHHHHHQRSVERFLRSQEDKIIQFASSASAQIDSVLNRNTNINPEDEIILPPEAAAAMNMPDIAEDPSRNSNSIPEPIEKEE